MAYRRSFTICSSILFSLLLMPLLACASSSTYISDSILDIHGSTGRGLLQAKKGCPVNFEFLDYSVITNECKGPHYPADRCCSSFKALACPYADVLNDLTNDCASTMFSYINLYGRYPPGLFASECREGKQGLQCPANAPSADSNAKNGAPNNAFAYSSSFLIPASLVFLLNLF